MTKKIQELSNDTIIKIAAGEMIENPASIIKELVENSIDAGSDKISIEIKDNGASYIRVTDNGSGLSREDLELAFKRHTTSKIRSIEELDETLTLGFRGEALSSIASASDVKIISRTQDDKLGFMAKIDHNGNILEIEEIVANFGTTIICENLFNSIPVRKKYLISKNYEIKKTNDIITRLSLSNQDISIDYIKDDKLISKTNKNNSYLNNIFSILGKDVSENLIPINYKGATFSLQGYISNNRLYRSNRSNQFIFVNNRSINDLNLSKLIEKEYTSIIPLNRYPVYILFLEINPRLIDVNIHPKKDIIKFLNLEEIEDQLKEVIKNALRPNLKIYNFSEDQKEKKKSIFETYSPLTKKEEVDNGLNDSTIIFRDFTSEVADSEDIYIGELSKTEDILIDNTSDKEIIQSTAEQTHILENSNTESSDFRIFSNGYRYIGQLFFQYLLLEDNKDKILFIIDQHAAHERINYEKLTKAYEDNMIQRQHLISGYIVNLTATDHEKIISLKDTLMSIGFEIEDFGDNSVIIRTIPAYLSDINPDRLIREILDTSSNIKTNYYDIDPYLLMKKACVASIKSGDRMSAHDVNVLIERLEMCKMPLTCPHGRPTLIKYSKSRLDREFFRIQND